MTKAKSCSRMQIPGDWTFANSEVAEYFDQHVREQLPWYDLLTKTVGLIARHYIQEAGLIYDIGCSTGNLGKELEPVLKHRKATITAIDNSPAMKDIYDGQGSFILGDAVEQDYQPFDLAVCFLVLQFIPTDRRRVLIEKLTQRVKHDGAIIVVDKYSSTNDSPYIQTIKRRITLMGKVMTGTPSDEVIAKELSLSGVQRPINFHELFSGYKAVEFFSFGEFAGWIIEG